MDHNKCNNHMDSIVVILIHVFNFYLLTTYDFSYFKFLSHLF
jgi:hypothetical protein